MSDRLRLGLRYPEMIDVSRFAKRGSGGPTLHRAEAMQLSIELAGWLGPVTSEGIFDVEEDDDVVTERMRRDLEGLLREINARWQQIDRQRKLQAKEQQEKEEAEEEKKPKRKPKTDKELLENLPSIFGNGDDETSAEALDDEETKDESDSLQDAENETN